MKEPTLDQAPGSVSIAEKVGPTPMVKPRGQPTENRAEDV